MSEKKYDLIQVENLAVDITQQDTKTLIEGASKEVKALIRDIDVLDPLEITKWGANSADEINKFSDSVLSTVTSKSLEESKTKILNNLNILLKQIDMKEIKTVTEITHKKGIAKLIANISQKKEDMVIKYRTIGDNINKIESELKEDKTRLLESIKTMDRLLEVAENLFYGLCDYRYAGEILKRKIEEEIMPSYETKLLEAPTPHEESEIRSKLSILSDFNRNLSVKLGDFDVSMVVAAQKVPQLKAIQQNYLMLLQKINTTESTTLPVFKTAIIEAINVKQQQNESKVLSEIDAVTNKLLRANSENIMKQSIEIRKQVSQTSISYETLNEVMNNLINGIEEIRKIDIEYDRKRLEEQKKIRSIASSTRDTVDKLSAPQDNTQYVSSQDSIKIVI